jgi:hypothetical protein
MYRTLTLVTAIVLGTVLAARVWAQPPWAQPQGKPNGSFEGYWMGVDPVDGGDARRSLVRKSDGTYMLAARDSVLTLCGGTEHGFASFDDGTVIARNTMQSNTLTISCFNNGATVVLHVRFELVKDGLMLEFATLEDGTEVSTIVLHRVSVD